MVNLAALVLAGTIAASAQSPNTAALIVAVEDQTGAAVPGAEISISNSATGDTRRATSGAQGSVTVAALPIAGSYTVRVTKPGFSAQQVAAIVLRAGETAVARVKLVATGGVSEVTVYGTAEGVRNDPELGTRLPAEQIEEIPVLGRKISALPLLNAAFRPAKGTGDLFLNSIFVVTGAGGRRQADFVVDGASGDEPWGRQAMFSTIPMSAVQEMNVMSRAFSAEFGWTSSAAVNIVTKAGSNDTHGEALLLGRPGALQASAFGPDIPLCAPSAAACVPSATLGSTIVPPDIPDSLLQGSIAVGGPLVKDRTRYFAAGDVSNQTRTATLTTPLVAPGTTFTGDSRQLLVNARVDHEIDPRHSLMARVNVDRVFDTNPQGAVSGLLLPTAGRRFTRHAAGAQANATSIVSDRMVNEARFEYQDADPVTAFDPLTPSTQFTRAGAVPFTSGESRAVHVFSRVAQLSDTLSWTRDRHYVRAGGQLSRSTSGGDGTEFGSAFVLGQYTVLPSTTAPPERLTLADMQRYQQSFTLGAGRYELSQWIGAVFAQDSYRARSDLTLDLGLRYDRQTFSDGTKNVAPRAGFGWNPAGDPRTSVRGGYGLYFTQLRANNDASFELGGPEGIFTYTAAPGQIGFPACITCTPVAFDPAAARTALPPGNITIRPGRASYYARFFDVSKLPGYAAATFVNPKSQVASIGVEREIVRRLFVGVDYIRQHWTGIDQTVDLNAPSLFVRTAPGQTRSSAAADATRPIAPVNGGFRQINVIENLATADYDGLQTSLRWRTDRALVTASYTLSKATNTTEPDGNAAGPNDFNQLRETERAPSVLDQRHRAVVNVAWRLPYGVTAGSVAQFASARPFSATTGLDNNGDTVNSDRPVIDGRVVGRYAFRGTGQADVELFAEDAIRAGRGHVILRAEVFNVFNRANLLGRNGSYGDGAAPSPAFGTAIPGAANVDPGRTAQLQVRFVR